MMRPFDLSAKVRRFLKPDNSVAITVLGYGREFEKPTKADRIFWTGKAQRTVLTIHVKKSDVDAFAKGELTLDKFRQQATVLAYCGDRGSLEVWRGAQPPAPPPVTTSPAPPAAPARAP